MGVKNNAAAESDRELVIERVFEAPRELVFRAFTEIEMALHWMGPREFPMTYLEMARLPEGGRWKRAVAGRRVARSRRARATGFYVWVGAAGRFTWTGNADHDRPCRTGRQYPDDVPPGNVRHQRESRWASVRLE
jgi:hypothetical protein